MFVTASEVLTIEILGEVIRFHSLWIGVLEENSQFFQCTDEALWIDLSILRGMVDQKVTLLTTIIYLAGFKIVLVWA